ncbi:enoyl-[acyl-carrier-protein] reductase [Plasmodiophora brassicae]|uniref:Enoyl-[acyl-carrier-protein] reductase, mitochondrial n=1 Tax=Plasmodiophora brassicae TaxID=37360 RepID=A0A0G4IV64_PLABS|nr:hypothetical protein PBRA_001119 [Plasmodiophora brassicae]SPQ97226.1 unnamed protein product [Plasmodiophora brassicae]
MLPVAAGFGGRTSWRRWAALSRARAGCRAYVSGEAALYRAHGEPEKVISVEHVQMEQPGPHDLIIKFLASPINPADINMIEGVYPVKPATPAVGGNEGVAVVEHKGRAVKSFNRGDWVIPARPGLGTWRTRAVVPEWDLAHVPNDIPLDAAAMLAVNPASAYRMLQDFVTLLPGDYIIQNAANSTVGKCVIQLAKHMGVKTINVVRDREDLDSVKEDLDDLGADFVVTESLLAGKDYAREFAKVPKPVLALNAVGGPSATNIARALAPNGTLVTYGGMSKKPVTLPTGLLIFQNIVSRGFWLSRWTENTAPIDRDTMIMHLASLIREGRLKVGPSKRISFTDLPATLADRSRGKVLIEFDDDRFAATKAYIS